MAPKKRAAPASANTKMAEKQTKLDEFRAQYPTDSGAVGADDKWALSTSQLLVYRHPEWKDSPTAVMFDMDGTLITTASGRVFPKDTSDWKLWSASVTKKLKAEVAEGRSVVVISNQAGVEKKKVPLAGFRNKFEAIVAALGVPALGLFCIASKSDLRKPAIGMWKWLLSNTQIRKEGSCYVGDAAGRPVGGSRKKKDFAASDRCFASNCRLLFHTPEEFFLNESLATFHWPYVPNAIVSTGSPPKLEKSQQELVIMVGPPGAGKSTLAIQQLASYSRVNRDTLKTIEKCEEKCEDELKAGRSVVVDNTCPDPATRGRFLAIAKKHSVPARCFHMEGGIEAAKHNERFRQLTQPDHEPISGMVYNIYKNKYAAPSLSEGFTEVVLASMSLHFEDSNHAELYSMYLLEG